MYNYAVCVMRRNYNLMITIVDTFSNKYEGHLKTLRPRSYSKQLFWGTELQETDFLDEHKRNIAVNEMRW